VHIRVKETETALKQNMRSGARRRKSTPNIGIHIKYTDFPGYPVIQKPDIGYLAGYPARLDEYPDGFFDSTSTCL
jgi:hypothetical protein